jgi:hypothetical protein
VKYLTQNELDHLFVVLLLHPKTAPAEQAARVEERAEIWRKLVAASNAPPSEETTYRTNLFESPEYLRQFWKDPAEILEAFLWIKKKAKRTKAATL